MGLIASGGGYGCDEDPNSALGFVTIDCSNRCNSIDVSLMQLIK